MVYPKKEYALYKGDNLLKIGTAEEIAEELGIKKKQYYFTNRRPITNVPIRIKA